MMKMKVMLLAVAMVAMAAVTANAVLVGELGILDLAANGGINPNTGSAWVEGDQYRLAFHTDGKIDALSNDPGIYNAFVTAEAGLAGLGGTWTALVTVNLDSTMTEALSPKSDPRIISGTDDLTGGAGIGGAGVPVYATDGTTSIARNNADIWNTWSSPFANANGESADSTVRLTGTQTGGQAVHYSPFLDQYGAGDSGVVHGVDIWSGTNSNGTPVNALGSTSNIVGDEDVRANIGSSNANNSGRVWNRFQRNLVDEKSLYALSAPLTVVPEPATMLLLGLGGLVLRRRRA